MPCRRPDLPAARATALPLALLLGCDQARVLHHEAAIAVKASDVEVGEVADDLHLTVGDELRRVDLAGRLLDSFPSGDKGLQLVALNERDLAKGPVAYVRDRAGLWRVRGDGVELLIGAESVDLRGFALTDEGLVTLEVDPDEGCALRWSDAQLGALALQPLSAKACAAGALLRADRGSGLAFVVTLDGLWIAGPTEAPLKIEAGGNLAAFDPAVGALVVGTRRDTELRAWDLSGVELWYQDLVEPLIAIDDMGALGATAALTSRGEGGRVIVLDTPGGAPLTADDLPLAPAGLSASAAGDRLVLRFPAELHVFDVDLEAL